MEHQTLTLPHQPQGIPLKDVIEEYFTNLRDTAKAVDVVQVVFNTVEKMVGRTRMDWGEDAFHPEISPSQAIDELNRRFRENNVGYQYYQGQILKQDSQFTHAEITVPALQVLAQPFLRGANQEFLCAHEHFRHGRFKECINECLKAFESTMKSICDKHHWTYNPTTDTASTLIRLCIRNGLFPVFLQSELMALRTILEAGVPTARNRTSAHGAGATPTSVSEEFAQYVMNLTAANIRFLADSEQKLNAKVARKLA